MYYSNLILNIPHSSTKLNTELLPLKDELLYMTDWYTDELFDSGVGIANIAHVSRLICDTERFRDPREEPMEKIGMGICYLSRHDGTKLIDYKPGHRDSIIAKYYDPYHKNLTNLVDMVLLKYQSALLLDCHSFSPTPLPYEPDQNPDRPDICIGTDSFHTPKGLIETTNQFFRDKGYSVKINSPYAGTIVPIKHLYKNKKVHSIMIELNRGLYLKEGTKERNDYFSTLKQHLKEYQSLVSRSASGLLKTS